MRNALSQHRIVVGSGPAPVPEGRSALVKRGGAYVGARWEYITHRRRRDADSRRRSIWTGPSPREIVADAEGRVPPGSRRYGLAAVTERPLDQELQGLVRAFKAWTPEKRTEVQGRISLDEQYTLIHFAKRCSVLALKEQSLARCRRWSIGSRNDR